MRKVSFIITINLLILAIIYLLLLSATFIFVKYYSFSKAEIEKYYPMVVSISAIIVSTSIGLANKIKNEKVYISWEHPKRSDTWELTITFHIHNDTSYKVLINKIHAKELNCNIFEKQTELAAGEHLKLICQAKVRDKYIEIFSQIRQIDFTISYSIHGKVIAKKELRSSVANPICNKEWIDARIIQLATKAIRRILKYRGGSDEKKSA